MDADKNKENTNLVIWGENLPSSVGNKRLTKVERDMVKLPPFQHSVIIGLLLSDGWLTFGSSLHKNARLGFKQSLSNSEYVLFVFNILSHYCSSYPIFIEGTRAGNKYYALQFLTTSLPCITKLHPVFYTYKEKRIPYNIYELLTPVALAHVIMGDGVAKEFGLILCTDSYILVDVIRLMNVLMIRYRLECTLRYHRPTHPRIYIRQRSMPIIRELVKPYIARYMLYKIGL